jgi:transposase InsO family protein
MRKDAGCNVCCNSPTGGWRAGRQDSNRAATPELGLGWSPPNRRLDEQGPEALVRIPEPVNKFPEFVGYLARRLKTLCPILGKRKAAEILVRAGLHLSASSVGRMLAAKPPIVPPAPRRETRPPPRVVTAKRPNHVWHVDLTAVPIMQGFWCPWLPNALPQCWPFCWWVAVIVDHFSRRVMGTATFYKQPSSEQVRVLLGRTIRKASAAPKYLICDKGVQFWCDMFKTWCRRRGIKPRYGAIGKKGSIAVVERCILTIKQLLACLAVVPQWRPAFNRELTLLVQWYNEHRPHDTLRAKTPNEAYHHRFPACRKPRHEPRSHWPRGSPCARPWALVRGAPGGRLELEVDFLMGRKHLPIVRLKRVA